MYKYLFSFFFFHSPTLQIKIKLLKYGQAISYTWSVSQQPCFDQYSHSHLVFFFVIATDRCGSCSEAQKKSAAHSKLLIVQLNTQMNTTLYVRGFIGARATVMVMAAIVIQLTLGQICYIGSKITFHRMTFSSIQYNKLWCCWSWRCTYCSPQPFSLCAVWLESEITLHSFQSAVEWHTKLNLCLRC